MVNKCSVAGCTSNYHRTGDVEAVAVFSFPKDEDLFNRWKRFCNRLSWEPTKTSRICRKHFEPQYLKKGETAQRWRLITKLKPVPTIYSVNSSDGYVDDGDNQSESSSVTPMMPKSSLTPTITVPRKSPKKRVYREDELNKFLDEDKLSDFSCVNESLTPPDFICRMFEDHVVYYRLSFDENSIPTVMECIRVDNSCHVQLYYKGIPVPLPNWFRQSGCKLTNKSMMINFLNYLKIKNENNASILEELRELGFKKAPIYSSRIIRYALLLRYTSFQAYKLLQEEFPLPSLSLLNKISSGGVDPVKAAKLLLDKELISKDVVLMVDEMYLQKSADYHSGDLVGCDESGVLYKGIVGFMIVGLKKSIPYIIKSIPEVKIEGEWLKDEILKAIETLHSIGFKVRCVVADNHSTNVSAYSKISNAYGFKKDDLYFITQDGSKIYLFYDSVHLMKNVRNNLLNNKRFIFPEFNFSGFYDDIVCESGEISWKLFHDVYESDEKVQGNLRKAPKIKAKVLHPGSNKQSVPLALAIFDETTSAAILSYFPEHKSASSFLKLFNSWWIISNSKLRFNSHHRLGNAAVANDKKPEFLRRFAEWIENWKEQRISNCEKFTLTENTSSALKRTLRCSASLIEDLLNEDYDYILTSRFQSDPLERRYSQYRQMSGGRFLVALREVNSSEKILKIRSLLKENINFWEEDLSISTNSDEKKKKLTELISEKKSDVDELIFSKDSREVAVYVAGYVAKKCVDYLKNCDICKLIGDVNDETEDNSYLIILNRGGLTLPSLGLSEYVINSIAALEYFEGDILSSGLPVREASGLVLTELFSESTILCNHHSRIGHRYINRTLINIYFNNDRKVKTDSVTKDNVAAFKSVRRTKT